MRKFLISAAAAAVLAACSPPAQQQADRRETSPESTTIACNDVAPDAARQISIGEEVVTAAAASDLRGGAIAPGTYDLVNATRIGGAAGWTGTRAVALAVTEDQSGGVTFNWAGAEPDGDTDRWTASFVETPQPRMTYSCGRVGEVAADFAAQNNTLHLRLQDGANGQLALQFERRS